MNLHIKIKRLVFVVVALAITGVHGVAQRSREDEYRRLVVQWRQATNPADTARGLITYREQHGPTPDVDYMLASSLCRVPATVKQGYKHFQWMLEKYRLDEPSRRLVQRYLDQARAQPTKRFESMTFRARNEGWVASVEGRFSRVSLPFDEYNVDLILLIRNKSKKEVEAFVRDHKLSTGELTQALGEAAARDDDSTEILSILIRKGAKVRNIYGAAALLTAARAGTAASVKVLIEAGVDLNTSAILGTLGAESLRAAISRDDDEAIEIVRVLHANKVSLKRQRKDRVPIPILEATHHGRLDVVRYLLENGADPNDYFEGQVLLADSLEPEDFEPLPEMATTPLMFAAGRTDIDSRAMVKLLLEYGAQIKSPHGAKAMTRAAAAGNSEVIHLLLKAGVDVNSPDAAGNTPLMAAAQFGEVEVVKTLLSLGANPMLKNPAGQTAEQIASMYGYDDVKTLLDAAVP